MTSRIRSTMVFLFLCLASLIVLYPVYYAIASSFMTDAEIESYPPAIFPSSLRMENFIAVMTYVPVARFMLNSLIVAASITVGHLATASLAAYAFAYIRLPGKAVIFTLFISTMMIPWEVTLIPNFLMIRDWGLLNTYGGLILPFLVTGFGTFLLRQFFLQLPKEIFEAAKIDGYGHVRIFTNLVLPLSRSAIVTLGIHSFIGAWNMYLWPLLVTNDKAMRTVQIGVTMLRSEENNSWSLVLAGVTLMMLPSLLMLIFGVKRLAGNLTVGALKG
ncbi:carbohydrate ABC transporter permease [Paenibacillus sp. TRM 82003]|nr:carbohydrate ABC transporter permease [Paenibacillus sp. TRM 82003]